MAKQKIPKRVLQQLARRIEIVIWDDGDGYIHIVGPEDVVREMAKDLDDVTSEVVKDGNAE
jgi:hypothetical protein